MRTLCVVVLADAMVRHQLLGIDVKVRWTISKSTVAAVFIAVFFIASEAAQQFFGDRLGGVYVGIAAAGMLVFAIAPLQRAAERLAEKAVPVAPATNPEASTEREGSFIAAVRMALKDGNVTKSEERALLVLADHLGIRPARAFELRDQVEHRSPKGATSRRAREIRYDVEAEGRPVRRVKPSR